MLRPMSGVLLKVVRRVFDAVKYSAAVRAGMGTVCLAAGWLLAAGGIATDRRRRLLLAATRLFYPRQPSPRMRARLAREGEALARAWTRGAGTDIVGWSIILKAPAGDERGVLLIAFEHQWLRLLANADLAALRRDYDLVLAPTWSPPYDEPMLAAASVWQAPLTTQLSNFADGAAYCALAPNLRPVPLLAASWVHPGVICPVAGAPIERDLVVLANFGLYKRHFDLFRTMAEMRRTPSVLCIGFPHEGRGVADVRREAAAWGVEHAVDFRVNVTEAELCALVSSSRAAVIMSRVEGSCVAVADLLWLDRPVAVRADAHIGSKAFINAETGILLRAGRMAADLEALLARADTMRPRDWMLAHGHDAFRSTAVLDTHLVHIAAERGGAWRTGLATHCAIRNCPRYASTENYARLAPAYAEFASRYGVSLGDPASRSPVV